MEAAAVDMEAAAEVINDLKKNQQHSNYVAYAIGGGKSGGGGSCKCTCSHGGGGGGGGGKH